MANILFSKIQIRQVIINSVKLTELHNVCGVETRVRKAKRRELMSSASLPVLLF